VTHAWRQELQLAANLSTLYPTLPLHERPYAAAADGFHHVETWWPFPDTVPTDDELQRFCESLERAGVRLVSINLAAGNLAHGDRGTLSHPGADREIARNVDCISIIVRRTGCSVVNAIFGNRVEGVPWPVQRQTGLQRLVSVADKLSGLNVYVVVETLNAVDSPRFPLTNIADTVELVRQANETSRTENVGLLVDTYHLAVHGIDPAAVVRAYPELVRHVQFADFPGRGKPGTGDVDFGAIAGALGEVGYTGFIGLEYWLDGSKQDAMGPSTA